MPPMVQPMAMPFSTMPMGITMGVAEQQAPWASEDTSVLDMLQKLGITHEEEPDFGWIAELGIQTPLPPRWVDETDPGTGCTYYVDQDAKTSTWDNPLIPFLRRIVELGREFLQEPKPEFFELAQDNLWADRQEDLQGWHGPFTDFAGRDYYVNSNRGLTSSQDPRIEVQYIFDLQCSFLSSLADVLPAPDTPGSNWHGNAPVMTDSGAEVLTLDHSADDSRAQTTPRERTLKKLATMKQNAHVDHKTILQQFRESADRLFAICDEEEEQQLIAVQRKVEQRKQAKAAPPRLQSSNAEASVPHRQFRGVPLAPVEESAPMLDQELREAPKPGRNAPMALAMDEEDDEPFNRSTGSTMAAVPPPAMGAPSPANFLRPPPSPWAPQTPLGDFQTPHGGDGRPAVFESPALRKRQPGKEWAAEAFIASTLAAASA